GPRSPARKASLSFSANSTTCIQKDPLLIPPNIPKDSIVVQVELPILGMICKHRFSKNDLVESARDFLKNKIAGESVAEHLPKMQFYHPASDSWLTPPDEKQTFDACCIKDGDRLVLTSELSAPLGSFQSNGPPPADFN